MALRISREEVWAADLQDQPGGLAQVLETLAAAGANLDCVIARRRPERPGSGVVYLTPVKAGAQRCGRCGAEPGQGDRDAADRRIEPVWARARMLRAIADAGVNIRGVSTAAVGDRFVCTSGWTAPKPPTARRRR